MSSRTPSPLNIQLRYDLDPHRVRQTGADLRNPLLDLLHALQSSGSIKGAAESLGQSYRHVWGSLRQWEETLGQELIVWQRGRRAELTAYSQRLIWAERRARVRLTPHLEALRAELGQVLREAMDSRLQFINVAASHDLGVGCLQDLAASDAMLHMKLRFTGSEQALKDLNEGICDLAGFHVPRLSQASGLFRSALAPHLRPGEHKLISSHRRRQGWMLPHTGDHLSGESVSKGWAMLRAPGTRLVNRQPGSGTRLLLDHLLEQQGLPPDRIDGYHSRIEHTHVAVAAMIAGGTADIGLGVEAVARDFGLRFEPLVEEDYYLVCLKGQLDGEPIAQLRRLLAQPSWATHLERLAGYEAHRPGQVLSLIEALPWWRFEGVTAARSAEPGQR